jgi:hypothetical protein
MYEYKYIEDLEAVRKGRALYKGSWIHACLETHYRDGDWQLGHLQYLTEYNKLFDEEKEMLDGKYGPLPQQIERIIRSYLWYWRNDGWEVIATEKDLESVVKLPIVFHGRTDLIIRDGDGLNWVVDHKSALNIPDPRSYHAMDPQLMLYPWDVEKELRIKIAGVIYNYVGSRPPSVPQLLKSGGLSKRKVRTDYPTLYRFLKKNGYDPNDFAHVLGPLQRKSPFLRRYRLPREKVVTKGVIADFYNSGLEIYAKRNAHAAGEKVHFIRNITKDCATGCSFHNLCFQELNGFDTTIMRRSDFRKREVEVDHSTNGTIELEDEG